MKGRLVGFVRLRKYADDTRAGIGVVAVVRIDAMNLVVANGYVIEDALPNGATGNETFAGLHRSEYRTPAVRGVVESNLIYILGANALATVIELSGYNRLCRFRPCCYSSSLQRQP